MTWEVQASRGAGDWAAPEGYCGSIGENVTMPMSPMTARAEPSMAWDVANPRRSLTAGKACGPVQSAEALYADHSLTDGLLTPTAVQEHQPPRQCP